MTFSIIITTYNRQFKVVELVSQLNENKEGAFRIIVVDSSDEQNVVLRENVEVTYLLSSHKNQPYQRFIGYSVSDSDILIFLDDDMELVDKDFLNKLSAIFEDNSIAGVAIKFENKHNNSLVSQLPQSNLIHGPYYINRFKRFLTGNPQLSSGKFGLCGNRGKQPAGGGKTEWVSGGAFAVRRKAMFNNFNFQLFDLFERNLGMGEDLLIGYGISKQGFLYYHDELFFLHNDQRDSTYSNDLIAFTRRVAFSRLFLSLERARLNNDSYLIAHLHYHYYMFWRITGLFINFIFSPSKIRKKVLNGTISGWILALRFKFLRVDERNRFWNTEAISDIRIQI